MKDYSKLKFHNNLKWALVCVLKIGLFFQEGCRFNAPCLSF